MAIKRFFTNFIIFSLFLALFSCKSVSDVTDNFTDLSIKVNVAIQVHLVLRTEDAVPDHFFIQNMQTYKMYEMTLDSKSMYYYEGLPIGTYRVGYWLASHDIGSPVFKCCGFADCLINIPYDKGSSSNLSLGSFYQHCSMSNLALTCTKASLHSKTLDLDHQGHFEAIPEECITNKDLTQNVIFTKYGCGSAEYNDDDYSKLEMKLNGMARVEQETIYSYIHVIDKEYRRKGIDGATCLINGFQANRYNDYFPVKLAQLYYNEGNLEECKKIIDKMHSKNANFPEYFGFVAMNDYKNGNIDSALTNFYKAVSLGSRWSDVYDSYANLLFSQNNLQMAQILSDYYLQIDSNNIKLLQTNLKIHEALKDSKRVAMLKKVINKLTNGGTNGAIK